MVARSTPMPGSSPGLSLQPQAVEEVDRRAEPQPERHRQRHDAGELQALAHRPQHRARQHDGKDARQDARPASPTNERNARPMKAATKTISIVSARLSLPIMSALLRAAIADEPGDRDLVARMRLAHGVERLVELIDHRQQLAGVDVGDASRHHDGVLLGRDEAARQMLRQDVDILLERVDDRPCRPSRRASAAASPATRHCRRRPASRRWRARRRSVDSVSGSHRATRPSGTRSARRSDWRRSAWRRGGSLAAHRLLACPAPGRRAGSAARASA